MKLPFQLIFWLIVIMIVAVFIYRLYGIYTDLRQKVLEKRKKEKKPKKEKTKDESAKYVS